jgi:TolA-binding protein
MEVDPASAAYALKAFTDFAYYCKSDSMSPVYLVKTAQVARAVNNIPQARTALDRCIEEYPAFRNRAAAIFLLAQLYDEPNYLNNEQEARKLYKEIVDEYPKSDWAMSAKAAIGFIGKTDEQIMQELKRKNQNK